jgi:outer membrane protein TolC
MNVGVYRPSIYLSLLMVPLLFVGNSAAAASAVVRATQSVNSKPDLPPAVDAQKLAASNYAMLLTPLDIYAPPPNARKLITLRELYSLVNTRGVSLKVARETFNASKQTVKTESDKKIPVLTMDLGHGQKWTKTMRDSDPTDDYADRKSVSGSRNVTANGGLSLTGAPVQGISYKLLFPQLAHTQEFPDTGTANPKRPDTGAFTASLDVALLKDNPMIVESLARKKSNLTLMSAREVLRQQTLAKIAEAEASYYGLAQKYLQLAVQERSLKLAQALERDVKEKIRAGESSALEATRAELQTAQAETDFMSSQIDYEAAVEEFRRSLAFDESDGQGIFPDPKGLDVNVEAFKVPADAMDEIRKSNADIAVSRIARQLAETEMELSRKGNLPSMAFTTSYSNTSPGNGVSETTSEVLRPNDRVFSVALTYSQILFNNTARNSLQQAILAKQKADFATDEAERKVIKDFNALIKKLDIGGRRYRIAKISREIAEKKLSSEYEKFKVGESSVRNVIDTQTEVNGARISEISARVEMLLGYAQLNALQGKLPDGVTMSSGS